MQYPSQRRFLRQSAQSARWSDFFRTLTACALPIIACLLLATPSFCADTAQSVKVLILWYGDKDSPALTEFENGLRSSMEKGLHSPVWIYDESFDQGWLGQASPYAQTMERFLNDKYAKRGIDIVVTIGNYPLQYMQQRHKTLLPNAKLMYFSWQSPQPPVPDTTGIVWSSDLTPTMEMALTQNPGTHHVLLVAGATELDRAMAQFFLSTGVKYLQEKHKDVDIRALPPMTMEEVLSTLAALPKDTITIVTTYYADSAGQGFVPSRILPTFSASANRPMYGWVDTYLGRGIVGGSLINIEAEGAAFGDIALRVVHGEKPGTIPEVRADFRQNAVDWKELKRWGIGMDKVPPGSTVINQEYTVWELYKWQIVGIIVLILVLAALIVNLIRLTLAQGRHVRQLAHQGEQETLIAELAAAFINLPEEEFTTEIEKSFQRVLEFFDLDRVSLFDFSGQTLRLRLLCARTSTGINQPPGVVEVPRAASQLLQGTPVVVSRLSQLPDEAGPLREVLGNNGVLSLAAFPLQHNGKAFATLTFSTVRNEREWNPDVVQAMGTIADIVGSALKRKNAEEAVHESQHRLTGIVESAMDAIIAVDDQQRIVVFNATAERIFGCPMDEALGLPLERFIPQRFRDQHHAHVSRFAETGVTNRAMGAQGVLYALRSNGEEFPIEASISQVKKEGGKLFTVIIRDITERAKAEHALEKSHQLNASILESLRNHVAVLDSDGTIVAATKQAREFAAATGINLLDLHVGANYFDLCRAAVEAGDSDVAAALAGVRTICDGKRDYFELEHDYRVGVDERWFLMSVTPLKASDSGVVISHQDITERKRHEQAIRDLSGRLITAQELERSRIARELHDDINQQVAMLAIELQQLESFLPESSPEGRERVQALWKKTHGLSKEIQHLSHQLHSAKLEHLGITAALRGLCEEFSAQHKIKTDFQFREVPPGLNSDISLSLFRVAQESLHNVAKHSSANQVRMELVGSGDKIVLRVSDDGIGFDPAAHRDHDGLGLISMNERIRLVGGTLALSSVLSLGTKVEATIPLSPITTGARRKIG